MSGHSKWHNIQKRKNAQDAKKGKVFMRHAKDIYTAAKQGGGDVATNASLRLVVDKAKSDNMPNENVERAIKKATGSLDGTSFEEITYEGYGPGGVAVIVHILTDNKNRIAAEIRHSFKKHNGNLGENGCVSFMFDRKGYIVIENEAVRPRPSGPGPPFPRQWVASPVHQGLAPPPLIGSDGAGTTGTRGLGARQLRTRRCCRVRSPRGRRSRLGADRQGP